MTQAARRAGLAAEPVLAFGLDHARRLHAILAAAAAFAATQAANAGCMDDVKG